MEEVWKPIKGYEGLYEVSNLGRVKALPRVIEEKILVPAQVTDGYLGVSLCKNNKKKTKTIHRLVAETFLENPNNLPLVNHKDEDRKNNRVDNLEFCTAKYNANYGSRNIKIAKRCGKALKGISETGEVITFKSTNEARKAGFYYAQIIRSCEKKTCYKGYYWSYA